LLEATDVESVAALAPGTKIAEVGSPCGLATGTTELTGTGLLTTPANGVLIRLATNGVGEPTAVVVVEFSAPGVVVATGESVATAPTGASVDTTAGVAVAWGVGVGVLVRTGWGVWVVDCSSACAGRPPVWVVVVGVVVVVVVVWPAAMVFGARPVAAATATRGRRAHEAAARAINLASMLRVPNP
jgi:hypothetical protein